MVLNDVLLQEKKFWNFYLVILSLNVLVTMGLMHIYFTKEGINPSGVAFSLSSYYLNIMNSFGGKFTSIEEVYILNYLISHLVVSFITAVLLKLTLLRKK